MDEEYYIVRVELHEGDDGTKPDYEELHVRMARNAFYRTIQDSDTGEWSWLPDATYFAEFSTNHQRVYARAIKVVKAYWAFSGLVVVPTQIVYYEGLRRASPADRARELASRRTEVARLADRRRNRGT